MNHNSGLRPDPTQELAQIAKAERNATGRGGVAWARYVNKNGASPAGDAGPRVMVDLDEGVVEAVIAPQPVTWFIGRPGKGPIVATIGGVLAPGIGTADTAAGQ
jgi:hypothetical protein